MLSDFVRYQQDRFVVMVVDDRIVRDLKESAYEQRLFSFVVEEGFDLNKVFRDDNGPDFIRRISAGVEFWPFETTDALGKFDEEKKRAGGAHYPESIFGSGEAAPAHLDVAAIDLNLSGEEDVSRREEQVEGLYLYRLLAKRHPSAVFLPYSAYTENIFFLKPLWVKDLNELRDCESGFFPISKREEDAINAVKIVLEGRRERIVRSWDEKDREQAFRMATQAAEALKKVRGEPGDGWEAPLRKVSAMLKKKVVGKWSLGRLYYEVGAVADRLLSVAQFPSAVGIIDHEKEVEYLRQALADRQRDFAAAAQSRQFLRLADGTDEQSRWVWKSDLPILLQGPIGSGKSETARDIHGLSRPKGPYEDINCAHYVGDVKDLMADLFGVKKGVFTGVEPRIGKLEQTNGGTLLLDEVWCLPAIACAALLVFLDDRRVRPLGAKIGQYPDVNVRLLFASHLDLGQLVAEGKFSEAFYSRIKHYTLRVPALDERKDAIPGLVDDLRKRWIKKLNKPEAQLLPNFATDAIEALQNRTWKFNVRELRDVVVSSLTKALILGPSNADGKIRADDLEMGAGEQALPGDRQFEELLQWLRHTSKPTKERAAYEFGFRVLLKLLDEIDKKKIPEYPTLKSLADLLGEKHPHNLPQYFERRSQ